MAIVMGLLIVIGVMLLFRCVVFWCLLKALPKFAFIVFLIGLIFNPSDSISIPRTYVCEQDLDIDYRCPTSSELIEKCNFKKKKFKKGEVKIEIKRKGEHYTIIIYDSDEGPTSQSYFHDEIKFDDFGAKVTALKNKGFGVSSFQLYHYISKDNYTGYRYSQVRHQSHKFHMSSGFCQLHEVHE